jgi:hypothetical protein
MTDVAEDTTQLQNAVRSSLSAMKPEESVAFASLVYFYNGRHVLCARVDAALVEIMDLYIHSPIRLHGAVLN